MHAENRNTICITNADCYVGQCIARYILRESQRGAQRNMRVRVTARDRQCCKDLERLGAEVYEVNYERRETLEEAFRECECVVLVPEMDKNRRKFAEVTIDCIKRANVNGVVMMSMIGAESDMHNLREYGEIERHLKENCSRGSSGHGNQNLCCCIMRLDYLQQCFYFWRPMIEQKGNIAMNINEGKFAPVNLNDVCCAVTEVVSGRRGSEAQGQGTLQVQMMDERHRSQAYNLTGPHAMCGEEIAQCMNRALNLRGEEGVRFHNASRKEMKQYFESLRKDRGYQEACAKMEQQCMQQFSANTSGKNERGDFEHGMPTADRLNDTEIETMLDFFELVSRNQGGSTSGDLQKIIRKEPESLENFLSRHKDQFRPGHGRA